MWYRTGTINLTNGSKNITGTGTLFNSNVKSGFALLGPDFSVYEVDNVSSDTAFTIKENYRGSTASNATYAIFQTQGIIKDLTDEVTALINTFGAFRDAYNNGDLVGQGLELKGVLNSPSDLPANPATGDAYLIGTYIYVYTGSVGGWKNSNVAGIIPRGAWNASTAYSVNDIVTYQGSQYRRKVAGTTASTPDADTTNWDLFVSIGQIGPAGITPRGTWSSSTAYIVNDTVQYNGSQYRRTIAGTTTGDPATDTTNWELFVSRGVDGTGSVNKVNTILPDLSGNVTLNTDNISEGSTNLWFTAARVRSTVLTGFSTATNAVVTATDTVLGGLGKLQAQLSNIASVIRSTVLTGFSTSDASPVVSTDTLLAAIGKLQAQNPAGEVMMYPTGNVPAGCYECNGQAVSRTANPNLFTLLGTSYGAGDGSTTFNVPDYRGRFPRAWDNGKGIDTGRQINTNQAEMVGPHIHTTRASYTGYTGGSAALLYAPGDNNGTALVPGGGNGVQANSGTENRPNNFAIMFVIRGG